MSRKIAVGAALQYSEQQLGGPLVENDATVSVSNTAATVVVDGNGDRVGLVLVNVGASDVMVSPDPAISSSNGIRLAASGGNVSMDVVHDFTMQTRRWYGLSLGAGAINVFYIELYRYALSEQK